MFSILRICHTYCACTFSIKTSKGANQMPIAALWDVSTPWLLVSVPENQPPSQKDIKLALDRTIVFPLLISYYYYSHLVMRDDPSPMIGAIQTSVM